MRCEPGTDADGSEELELPALDGAEGDDGEVDEPVEELALPDSGEPDPDDEAGGEWFVPELSTAPTAISDGSEDEPEGALDPDLFEDLSLAVGDGTLLDDGTETAAVDDEAVGVEPLPEAGDRIDSDGLDDPGAERVVDQSLPALDQGDDEPIDVGIDIPVPKEPLDSASPDPDEDAVPSGSTNGEPAPEADEGASDKQVSAQSRQEAVAAGSATNCSWSTR